MKYLDMSNYIFKGVYIPASVWLDTRLSPTQKMLLCEIDAMSNGKSNPCFAGNEHFAKHLHCTSSSISNMISKLINLGYIIRIFTNSKTYEGRKMWTNFTPTSYDETPTSYDVSINKPIKKPIKKLINSSTKIRVEDFKKFKRNFINTYEKNTFYTSGIGWLSDTPFILNDSGLILNVISGKLLSKDESFKIWNYLYIQNKQMKKG